MTTHSPAIRSGPLLALAIAFAIATPAGASDTPHHYYSIYGSLTPSGSARTSSNGGLELRSSMTRAPDFLTPQSGGDFVVMARLVYMPLVCYGDTIFQDGFDP